jgi:quinoprotein glucose dehydrogenase
MILTRLKSFYNNRKPGIYQALNAQNTFKHMKASILLCLLILALISCRESERSTSDPDYTKWEHHGGTKDGARYANLTQINKENVDKLDVAWIYNTGDATERSQIQCQPIVVNGVLYATTPQIHLFALDAATGSEIWRFDPFKVLGGENTSAGTNRGVVYWEEGDDKRIIFSAGKWLMAINAKTGEPISSFGDAGKIDLSENLDTHRQNFMIVSNTPGVLFEDKIIMGMRLGEGLGAPPGNIRAYNVKTGEREWIFHTIPLSDQEGYDTWDPDYIKDIGGANNWAGMSLDEERGIVYVPTGSATYDFWGGYRHGQNLYANTLLALNAHTGERIWHYQIVHHDMWDRDLPANPNLIRINKDGKWIDAVAQITKQGLIFVFDRVSGKPIWPIEERAVPASHLPGEKSWPTQPHPVLPEPFMRTAYSEAEIPTLVPEWEKEIREKLDSATYNEMWMPPSHLSGVVLFPGMDGGAEWGGASFEPETQTLYVNANEIPWMMNMLENTKFDIPGKRIYASQCSNCHGATLTGNPPVFPSLINLTKIYNDSTLKDLLIKGKGAMPSYAHLSESELNVLSDFLLGIESSGEDERAVNVTEEDKLHPQYYLDGGKRMLTRDGYPGIQPPWGTLNAIDMNTGKVKWKTVLGEYPELTEKGLPPTGTENYGGPVSTAGGLVFIAATKDEKIRAFDKDSGALLWEASLPASGHATPAVYSVDGKQFVVIACGGGKGTKSGDAYVAFALPY